MVRLSVQLIKIITIATVAVLVAAGGRWGFDYAMERVEDPDVGRPVAFEITEEDTSETIAAKLRDEDMINSEFYFTTQMQLATGEIRVGRYTLRHGMSVTQIVDRITDDGDGEEDRAQEEVEAETAVTDATIIEGWRTEQIAAEFQAAGLDGGAEAFLTATQEDYSADFEFLQELPEGATLEGYLFPDTYTVSGTLGSQDAVYQMLERFDEQFTPDMRERAAAMGLSIHQVVTLASIVEREVAVESERPIVAAVYLNRLEAGMRLESDPTVQYVLGTEEDWWPEIEPNQQSSSEAESSFNTYLNEGLPPGPICSPSQDSIFAVLNPDENNYLFFVTNSDGSGEHVFAETFEEHQVNVDIHLNGGG